MTVQIAISNPARARLGIWLEKLLADNFLKRRKSCLLEYGDQSFIWPDPPRCNIYGENEIMDPLYYRARMHIYVIYLGFHCIIIQCSCTSCYFWYFFDRNFSQLEFLRQSVCSYFILAILNFCITIFFWAMLSISSGPKVSIYMTVLNMFN